MLPDWQIWLDNNVAPIIGKWLKDEFGLNVKSAFSLQMQTASDIDMYLKAKEEGNIILISKDSDIADLINRHGSPPKLINIKIGNCTNRFLYSVLVKHILDAIRAFNDFEVDIYQIEL